jgi:hypothetical protein
VKPTKVFSPPSVMDDIYAGNIQLGSTGNAMRRKGDSAATTITDSMTNILNVQA